MNLIRIILVLLVSVGVPCTFSKTRKLQRVSLSLITLALLIQTVQSALQHNLEETAPHSDRRGRGIVSRAAGLPAHPRRLRRVRRGHR